MRQPKSLIYLVPALAIALATTPCFGDSQARIVRLSDVEGNVLIDRNGGQGYEKAILNLPITQGVKLKAGDTGRAELEMEDGSTVRIIPDTVVEIPQLSLRDSGAKVSSIRLLEGTAYFNFAGTKDDEFSITFVREKIALTHAAHLRVSVGDTDATVGVFKGDVEVDGPSSKVEISKNHKATFDLIDDDKYKLARDFEEEPFDSWDKQQDQYRDRYASSAYSGYSPYTYGTSDLNYYGSFSDVPGYGMMWQPYFAGAGWDPFMNGAWAFAPGFGYGWVSAYPWGWTPYHYGSWAYVPMYGWMWQPGGAWMGFDAIPVILGAPASYAAPHSPLLPGPRIVPVNNGPTTMPIGNSPTRVQIPNNSAGLGVPRGSLENLAELSQTAQQKGYVSARLHTVTVSGFGWGGGYGGSSTRHFGVAGAASSHASAEHSSSGHSGSSGHK